MSTLWGLVIPPLRRLSPAALCGIRGGIPCDQLRTRLRRISQRRRRALRFSVGRGGVTLPLRDQGRDQRGLLDLR